MAKARNQREREFFLTSFRGIRQLAETDGISVEIPSPLVSLGVRDDNRSKERNTKQIKNILARCCGVVKKKEKRVRRPAKTAEKWATDLEKLFLMSVK
jgi:hypothetical protein